MKTRPPKKPKPHAPFREIGERLEITRAAIGGDQTEFASRAGIKQNTYNQWENGKKRPDIDGALRLCSTYSLSLDWIYMGEPGNMQNWLVTKIRDLRAARASKAT